MNTSSMQSFLKSQLMFVLGAAGLFGLFFTSAPAAAQITTVFVSKTNGEIEQVTVSGGAHMVVGSTGVGQADSLVFDPAGKLLVSGLGSPNIFRIDPSLPGGAGNIGTQVNATPLSQDGADQAIDSTGMTVYVTDFGVSVDAVDLTTGAVTVHALSGISCQISGIAFDASGQLWVTDYCANTVGIADLTSNTYTPLCTGVAVGAGGADGLSFDSLTGTLYVSGQATNTITALTIGSGTCSIGTVFSMGTDGSGSIIQPDGIAADGLGGVFAAGQNGDVVRLDTTTGMVAIIASGLSGLDDIAPVFGQGAPPTPTNTVSEPTATPTGTPTATPTSTATPTDTPTPAFCGAFPCGNGKVSLCHFPPGNPANAQTLCIDRNAVPAHLANHGDRCGPCGRR